MIYFIQDATTLAIKIGYTEKDAVCRLATLQTGNAAKLVLLAQFPGDRDKEQQLHRRFADARIAGEWFRAVPDLLLLVVSESRQFAEYEARQAAEAEADNHRVEQLTFLCASSDWDDACPTQIGSGLHVNCPICGFDCNHIGEVRRFDGDNQWAGNGRSHVIEMSCEAGHNWLLGVGFHKGHSVLFSARDPTPVLDPDEATSDF